MTRWRFKKNPASGAVAVYSVPSRTSLDNSPLIDPDANKDKLQLHTDYVFPSTTPEDATAVTPLTRTVTVNIPSIPAGTKFGGPTYRYQLFEHGFGQPCMVEGLVRDLGGVGNHIAINGSLPVESNAMGFGMWFALGATATHVVLEAFGITQFGQVLPAKSYQIEASAYDFLATGPAPTSNPALPSFRHFPGSHTIIARGVIDTRRRYVRAAGIGPQFAIPTAETLKIVGRGIGDDTTSGRPSFVQFEIGWRWRYSVAGYVRQTTIDWRGNATNGGTYNAPVLLVKR